MTNTKMITRAAHLDKMEREILDLTHGYGYYVGKEHVVARVKRLRASCDRFVGRWPELSVGYNVKAGFLATV